MGTSANFKAKTFFLIIKPTATWCGLITLLVT